MEETTTLESNTSTYGTRTYLDIEVSADDRTEAITHAVSVSRLFVQLLAFVYLAGFEISMVGIQTIKLAPKDDLEPSTYFGKQTDIASLQNLTPIWEQVNSIREQDEELWQVLRVALEWLYFGAIANEERNISLAYRIALEVLLRGTEGNEVATTVFKKHLNETQRSQLKQAITGVLALCIPQAKDRQRIISHMEDTLSESDADRWARLLTNSGVSVSAKELAELQIGRSQIVHRGVSSPKMSITRVREMAIAYMNTLLKPEA